MTAEFDFASLVFTRDEPNVAHFQPVVREFHLPAVDDFLFEDPEFVTDGVTGSRNAHGAHRVHVAGSQTAQAAVAKPCVRFHAHSSAKSV